MVRGGEKRGSDKKIETSSYKKNKYYDVIYNMMTTANTAI